MLEVARSHDLICDDPLIVRDLSNVLVHLRPAPVIARVATMTASVREGGAASWLRREVEVAAHLVATGAPAVRPSDELPPGLHAHDGWFLTFWRLEDHDPNRPLNGEELGRSLRELHEALADYDGELPTLDSVLEEVGALLDSLAASGALGSSDLRLLRGALDRLSATLTNPALPVRPLHGDAHVGNVLRTPEGVIWTDLEDACVGPIEWDLACLVADSRVFGTDGDLVEQALAGYGAEPDEEKLLPFFELRALQVAVWGMLIARDRTDKSARAEARLKWWRERERPPSNATVSERPLN